MSMTEWQKNQAEVAKLRLYPKPENDPVNNPKHYELLEGVEVLDVIRAVLTDEEYRGWLKGNSIKYLLRADSKGKPEQDRQKCRWMLTTLEDV